MMRQKLIVLGVMICATFLSGSAILANLKVKVLKPAPKLEAVQNDTVKPEPIIPSQAQSTTDNTITHESASSCTKSSSSTTVVNGVTTNTSKIDVDCKEQGKGTSTQVNVSSNSQQSATSGSSSGQQGSVSNTNTSNTQVHISN